MLFLRVENSFSGKILLNIRTNQNKEWSHVIQRRKSPAGTPEFFNKGFSFFAGTHFYSGR